MKHVWILNHYAQEPGGPGGTRHYSLARHLPAHGWKATIIAASTEHGTSRQRLGEGERRKHQALSDVAFLWLHAGSYSSNGGDRVRNMLDYTYAVLRPENVADLGRPDAIIGSSVHPLAAWAGNRLAKRYRVPFLFEVRDLWPQTLIDMGRISYWHPAAISLRRLERSLYRNADRIVTLLPKANEYIEPLGISSDKIVWIPNGVDVEEFGLPSVAVPSNYFTFMYFGAHGTANGLANLLRAMQIVSRDPAGSNIQLRLIGQGPIKSSLIVLARDLSLTNVSFEDPVAKSEIPALAAQADAFVFNLIDTPVFKYGISSNKLFDFMAAQRPVLFCCNSSNNPIAESSSGMTVPPDNPEALAAAMIEMASLPRERREEMGAAGRAHLESNYSMERLAGRLALTLDACLTSR